MKSFVISPRTGTVRISRFSVSRFDVAPVQEANPMPQRRKGQIAGCELSDDLRRRETAPFELSAALRARLRSACSANALMAGRQN